LQGIASPQLLQPDRETFCQASGKSPAVGVASRRIEGQHRQVLLLGNVPCVQPVFDLVSLENSTQQQDRN
jgi:hypothetical protein